MATIAQYRRGTGNPSGHAGSWVDFTEELGYGFSTSSPLADMGMFGDQAISQEFPSGSAK
jgi:hypothetical protein